MDQEDALVPAQQNMVQFENLGDVVPASESARNALAVILKGKPKTSVSLDAATAAINTVKGASAQYKRLRRIAEARRRGKTQIKVPTGQMKTDISDFMTRLSGVRRSVVRDFSRRAVTAPQMSVAEAGWKNTIASNPNKDVLMAFGVDASGLQKRRDLASQGFQTTGGVGHFKDYYVANGVLRGGMRGKGIQQTAAGGRQIYSIPCVPRGDSRQLVSMQAKYVDPLKFPSTRIIKYLRGHWGQNAGVTNNETIW